MELARRRVVVMGLGRFGGGVGVTRFLARQGADVLVTDTAPARDLQQSLARLDGLGVRLRLGGHDPRDFARADLVVVNPAVDPRQNPCLAAARDAGAVLSSEIRLLVERLPERRRVIGVTGTAGKSTTTAMIGHALVASLGRDRVHVGGNLGGSLLDRLDAIGPDDWVVLELSSFMLEGLGDDGWSPSIAVATNLSPNHLDRHGTMEAYRRAKQVIFDHQAPDDAAVLGPGAGRHFAVRCGRVARVDDPGPVLGSAALLLPGRHNRVNAALAVRAVELAGSAPAQAVDALADFPGLPHRLQFVCECAGVRFINDSKATTPDAAVRAIDSLVGPPGALHVILGGFDKGSDLTAMASHAARACRGLYTIGATGEAIAEAAAGVGSAEVVRCGEVAAAVAEAMRRAAPGDTVLLSPGCASWDQFDHFEQRGRAFAEAVLRHAPDG